MRRVVATIGVAVLVLAVSTTSAGAASPHQWLLNHRHKVNQLANALTKASTSIEKVVRQPSVTTDTRAAATCTVLGVVNQGAQTWRPPAPVRASLAQLTTDITSFVHVCITATTPQTVTTTEPALAQLATDLGALTPDFKAFVDAMR